MLLSCIAFAVPRGTVEVGFESETYDSLNEHSSFVLPYVKTKTHFNETTPYYMEANYSFRYHTERPDAKNRQKDKRQRYELYLGGYRLVNNNFAMAPKIGVRYEEFANMSNDMANRTQFRFFPNMSYKINDTHAIGLVGYVSYTTAEQTGRGRNGDKENWDKRYSDYLHELSLDYRYKVGSRQTLVTSIFHKYETFVYARTIEAWELRFRFNHVTEDGKTTVSPYVRLPLNRETRAVTGNGERNTVDTDRTRAGVALSHKVSESWTTIGDVWYQSQTKENGPSIEAYFLKLALRYTY